MESKLGVPHANWKGRPTKPSRRWTSPPPPPPATCTICGDVFVEENFWKEESAIISYTIPQLSVIATLVCGHLYHVECLDVFIPSDRKCDPPCPLCEALEQRKNEVSIGEKFLETETETVERKNLEGKERDRAKASVQVSTKEKSLDKAKEMKKLSQPNQAAVEKKSLDKQVKRKKSTECITTKVEGSELDSSSASETTKRPQVYMTRARARAQSVSVGKTSANDRPECERRKPMRF
ncbi:uncharacterized protein [Aristolochia californica]|uniref:uncharacterized protein n=1 Tax=Aristolochia californica TaxID=171875 RepID=UPI0035E22C42